MNPAFQDTTNQKGWILAADFEPAADLQGIENEAPARGSIAYCVEFDNELCDTPRRMCEDWRKREASYRGYCNKRASVGGLSKRRHHLGGR